MSVSSGLLDSIEDQGKVYGVVVAVVTSTKDPVELGRVKVRYPWPEADAEGYWARVAAPMAGHDRGIFFLPEVDDEVLVGFEHGDVRFPYVLGSLWNGKHKPPVKNDDGKNSIRILKSRSGHIIRLDDTEDAEKIEIIDKSAKNSISIETKTNRITIKAGKDFTISAGGTIKLDAKEIVIKSSAEIKVESGTKMELVAPKVQINNGALEIT